MHSIKHKPPVSVIIPIYNVEKYIERCVRSLMEQTLNDIEYIFVNDCTPDRSIEILQRTIAEYPQRKKYIQILTHDRNRGSACARNNGVKAATGEYIIHCDMISWYVITLPNIRKSKFIIRNTHQQKKKSFYVTYYVGSYITVCGINW